MQYRPLKDISRALFVGALAATAAAAAAPTFTTGTYAAGKTTIMFDATGHVRVTNGDQMVVDGTYSTRADQISFVDKSGSWACPSAQVGVYRWTSDNDTIAFKKIDDACDGRSGDLTARPWKRQQ